VASGYFTPAIFSYNFLYGFLPGLTYDETLGLSSTLVLFRIITVLVAGALVWFSVLILENSLPGDSAVTKGTSLARALMHPRRRVTSGSIVGGAILVWFFRTDLGFESTAGYIQEALGGRMETEHMTIYYSKSAYDEEEIRWVAAEHEFRLKQVSDAFTCRLAEPSNPTCTLRRK
jgi:hypothetical protein